MTPFLNNGAFPQLSELDAYWHAKRPSGHLPTRADINPRGIAGALAHSFILERLEAGMYRLRLAGHAVNDLMGMEVRGMSPTALFTTHYQAEFVTLCDAVCARPAILQAEVSAVRGPGKPTLEGRLALWPLRDDDGYTTRILGGISYRGAIGPAPRALQITSHRLRMLQTVSSLPARLPQDVGEKSTIKGDGFAEAVTPFTPRGQAEGDKRPSHLRLVSNTEAKD